MNEASKTFGPAICEGSPNATFSPASEAGASPCAWRAGQTLDLFGPAPALANLSARQAKERGLLTSGTYGRTSTTSSSSADLQSSLESRLQARMGSNGWTLYALTWKRRATPLGRQICALRASAPRTSASGSTGSVSAWPTPCQRDYRSANALPYSERGGGAKGEQLCNAVVHAFSHLASSSDTSSITTSSAGTDARTAKGMDLAGWPTATTTDAVRSPSQDFATPNITLNHAAVLAGRPTPNSTIVDAKPNPPITSGRKPTDPQISTADVAVHLCGWPTPVVRDCRNSSGDGSNPRDLPRLAAICGPARLTASGEMLTGSDAGMESGGQLSPAMSAWLMGYPMTWCEAAIRANAEIKSKKKANVK